MGVDLVDRDREDPFARRSGTPRRLAVWVWYPAAGRDGEGTPAGYLPGAWRASSWMWALRGSTVQVHSRDRAPPAQSETGCPLVVFSPSVNPPLCYAGMLEQLASHGYVAAGVSHTYEVIPLSVFADARPRLARLASIGGAFTASGSRPFEVDLRERARVVRVKADDLAFVVDRLMGKGVGALPPLPPIDPTRSAVIGHSFGGGAAAEVCQRALGVATGVSIDGGLWREPDSFSPTVPIMQLFGEHPEYKASAEDAVRRKFFKTTEYAARDRQTTVGAWQALHDAAAPGHSAMVRGATHASFCDWPMLPLRPWSPARRALQGAMGAGVCDAVNRALVAFLGRHLRGETTDVAAVLEADDALRVADPADLFATQ